MRELAADGTSSTNRRDLDAFAAAVTTVTEDLTAAGYGVRTLQQASEFARMEITTARQIIGPVRHGRGLAR